MGLLLIAALCLLPCSVPAEASADHGFTWLDSNAAGMAIWPTGLDVWILPGKHATTDERLCRYAVRRLRSHGVAVRYRGFAAKPRPGRERSSSASCAAARRAPPRWAAAVCTRCSVTASS